MGVILAAGVVTAVLGPTSYCITFTPPFVSGDFNKLNTPIALMALCTLKFKTVYSVSVTYFLYFFTHINLVIFATSEFTRISREEQIR